MAFQQYQDKDSQLALFDSGVGGLSVAREILAHYHPPELVYLADNAHHPYGDRSLSEVRELTEQAISFLKKRGISDVVIACNTASAALAGREESFGIRVWNLIETGLSYLKEMIDEQKEKVGLIATPATVSSGCYPYIAHQLGLGFEFYSVASARLAPLIESGMISGEEVEAEIKRTINPLAEVGIRALILGCTHYPLARRTFQLVLSKLGMGGVLLYDPAYGMAQALLAALGNSRPVAEITKLTAILTAPSQNFARLAEACLVDVRVEVEVVRQLDTKMI